MVFNYTHVAYTIKEEILLIIASTRITTINQQLSIKDYNSQQKEVLETKAVSFSAHVKYRKYFLRDLKKEIHKKKSF